MEEDEGPREHCGNTDARLQRTSEDDLEAVRFVILHTPIGSP